MFSASFNLESLQLSGEDPVCGMKVSAAQAAAASIYENRTYYFCAPACKKQFDANPEKYVAKTSA